MISQRISIGTDFDDPVPYDPWYLPRIIKLLKAGDVFV